MGNKKRILKAVLDFYNVAYCTTFARVKMML